MGLIFNEKIDKKWNLWVHKQYIRILFTENWSNVAATVHVPYMNSSRKWGENTWKKKKKMKKRKRKTQQLKRRKREPKHTLNLYKQHWSNRQKMKSSEFAILVLIHLSISKIWPLHSFQPWEGGLPEYVNALKTAPIVKESSVYLFYFLNPKLYNMILFELIIEQHA